MNQGVILTYWKPTFSFCKLYAFNSEFRGIKRYNISFLSGLQGVSDFGTKDFLLQMRVDFDRAVGNTHSICFEKEFPPSG